MYFRSILIGVTVLILAVVGCHYDQPSKVCFKQHCFVVEIAATQEQREQGLMFRKRLDRDRGMLFIFTEEQIHNFWMKNTEIPLDIVWLNKNKEAVFIKENAKPCTLDNCSVLSPDKKALYVLEVSAGIVEDVGLRAGDKLIFDLNL
ncbi:MAG: DUF192 domain-containing protein [Candidatus Omnitrophica bacterium]|nr:DUF192 domain-containing protein [Candidatus Omnitrophota bacterium]